MCIQESGHMSRDSLAVRDSISPAWHLPARKVVERHSPCLAGDLRHPIAQWSTMHVYEPHRWPNPKVKWSQKPVFGCCLPTWWPKSAATTVTWLRSRGLTKGRGLRMLRRARSGSCGVSKFIILISEPAAGVIISAPPPPSQPQPPLCIYIDTCVCVCAFTRANVYLRLPLPPYSLLFSWNQFWHVLKCYNRDLRVLAQGKRVDTCVPLTPPRLVASLVTAVP